MTITDDFIEGFFCGCIAFWVLLGFYILVFKHNDDRIGKNK